MIAFALVLASCAEEPEYNDSAVDVTYVPEHPTPNMTLNKIPRAPLDMNRVNQIATMLPAKPKGFGPTYKNRAFWNAAYASGKYASWITKANTMKNEVLEPWDDAWEDQYFNVAGNNDSQSGKDLLSDRLTHITTPIWAECLLNDGSYMPKINDALRKLIHQKIWANPRNYVKAKGYRQQIELSGISYAMNLVMAAYLLDDKLTPEFRQEIFDTVKVRVLNSLTETIYPGDYDRTNNSWITGINNWNPVCFSGTIVAALGSIPDATERAKFVAIAEKYVQNYAVGFPADGYCTEGMSYYNYGYSHYILLRESILQATSGRLDIFRNDPRLRAAAMFALNSQVFSNISPDVNYYPAIADCSPNSRPASRIGYYMSKVLNMPIAGYANFSRHAVSSSLAEGVMFAASNSTDMARSSGSNASIDPLRSEFKEVGVLTVRPKTTDSYQLAAVLKGGHNGEEHNHNDLGSFTMYVGSQALIEDPGSTPYDGDTFGALRYTIKSLSSYGHATPYIAETAQIVGAESYTTVLNRSFTTNADTYKLDIAKAYRNISGITSLTREFTYTRGGGNTLEVLDEFEFTTAKKFEIALPTRGTYTISGNTITISRTTSGTGYGSGTGACKATITASGTFTISTEAISDTKTPYTRIAVTLDAPATSGFVKVVFTQN